MNEVIRDRLVKVALALTIAGAGAAGSYFASQIPPEVALAMEIGAHYESSGRHIGKPYVDSIGKGQPWTVCNGITGPEVDPVRTYTREDCKRLELPKYREAAQQARAALRHWGAYNVWVRASFIDMVFNVGPAALDGTTIQRLANAGDLAAACEQMPRWVHGTVNGQKVRLPGLVDRRATTRELCAEWGRAGHWSADLLKEQA